MNTVIYFGIILCSCAQSLLTKASGRAGSPCFFNTEKALFAFLLFALIGGRGFSFHLPTAVFAVLFAACLSVSMYFGYQSLCTGPVSLTSLIVSFSLVIPCIYGIVFLKEPLTLPKGAGLLCLSAAVLFANAKSSAAAVPLTKKWAGYTFLTLVSNGMCSVIQKMHQTEYPGKYTTEFMCFSMLFAALFFGFVLFFSHDYRKGTAKKHHLCGIFSGIANGGANYMTLLLAGRADAVTLFPLISVGTILASLAAGVILLRERLTKPQIAAVIAGIAAVICLRL